MKSPKNDISKVEVDWKTGDVTIFFEDSDEPWSSREFRKGTETKKRLKKIEDALYQAWMRQTRNEED